MAKVGRNIVTTGISGKIGDLIVFRTRGKKTYVSAAPEKKERELSPAQQEHLKLFQEAIIYGKNSISDPAIKAAYQEAVQGNQTAFNVAVADFLHAPQIDEIDVSNYNGHVGSTIRIRATDDFKVAQVTVAIYNADNSLVENGTANQLPNLVDWLYKAVTENVNPEGDKIVIRVTDMPGNLTQSEQTI